MASFGERSLERLETLQPDLQLILNDAILVTDFTILCGHRGEEAQNKAFDEGNSNLKYPDSHHNSLPSTAVDIAPWPINWNNVKAFYYLAGVIFTVAHKHSINIFWGGYWTQPQDCPHFQLD